MNKRLIAFALVYSAITIGLFIDLLQSTSLESLAYLGILPAFWISGGIALAIMMRVGKINLHKWNTVSFIFSTPAPTFLVILIAGIISALIEKPGITRIYHEQKHILKEEIYLYDNLKPQRKEYSKSANAFESENEYPSKGEEYLLDSIIYLDENGRVSKTEYYKNGQLIK
jgi:hypothetical protein